MIIIRNKFFSDEKEDENEDEKTGRKIYNYFIDAGIGIPGALVTAGAGSVALEHSNSVLAKIEKNIDKIHEIEKLENSAMAKSGIELGGELDKKLIQLKEDLVKEGLFKKVDNGRQSVLGNHFNDYRPKYSNLGPYEDFFEEIDKKRARLDNKKLANLTKEERLARYKKFFKRAQKLSKRGLIIAPLVTGAAITANHLLDRKGKED